MGEVDSELLRSSMSGDPKAAEQLLPLVYDELRQLAANRLRGERMEHTLQPTALVHEAYMRLVDNNEMDWQSRTHFLAMAAKTLRRVLIDHARGHGAQKRGGDVERASWTVVQDQCFEAPVDPLELNEALERLAESNERHAKVVELRFFAGLSVNEVAAALQLTEDRVKKDWRMARAWLNRELSRGATQPPSDLETDLSDD